MRTTLHTYYFNVDNPKERDEYAALVRRLSETNGECFRVWADPSRDRVPEGEIDLETTHLFSNQWNSTTHRVFDWFEGMVHNKSIKEGHYLDITDEMREIRRNTNVCGYCGHQERAERGLVFCDRCLDSPYLKETEIHLTRMLPVEMHLPSRAPLTKAERDHLLPEYVRRQTTGADSRNAQRLRKQREDIIAKCEKATSAATDERDGMLWLMDHGIDTVNVIYYSHTRRFCFGWRSPVSDAVASALLDLASEFPFAYEIKGTSRSWESHAE